MSLQRVEIVAEIANAHQGNPELAIRIALAAAETGADSIKFQIYTADDLLTKTHPRFEHFKNQAFFESEWLSIFHALRNIKVKIYADVFGLESLDVAKKLKLDGIKIHSSDLSNRVLIDALPAVDTLMLAVGGSTYPEIINAINWVEHKKKLREFNNQRLILLEGFQAYPTQLDDAHLYSIKKLIATFGDKAKVGYMDHLEGGSYFSYVAPLMAYCMGATMLEKHITIDREKCGIDYFSSINPDDFKKFVLLVRQAEAINGLFDTKKSQAEIEYRKTVKKHWTCTSSIDVNENISAQKIAMKRHHLPYEHPAKFSRIVNRVANKNIEKDDLISHGDVSSRVWALIIVRLKSSRLPEKALIKFDESTAIDHLIARVKRARSVEKIVLCTTTDSTDDRLEHIAKESNIYIHRGPIKNVLSRMLGAVKDQEVDAIVRITGDDILVDPEYLDLAVSTHLNSNAEYTSSKKLPSGTEVEVFDVQLLEDIEKSANDLSGTEYLTTYILNNADNIACQEVEVKSSHQRNWRLTLDTPEDESVVRSFLNKMKQLGRFDKYRLDDIVNFFESNPKVLDANKMVRQRSTPIEVDTTINWKKKLTKDISEDS
jgi:N,N'-diacetyllegionaminate synthase